MGDIHGLSLLWILMTLIGKIRSMAAVKSLVKEEVNSVAEEGSWTLVNYTCALHHLPKVSQADCGKRRTRHLVAPLLTELPIVLVRDDHSTELWSDVPNGAVTTGMLYKPARLVTIKSRTLIPRVEVRTTCLRSWWERTSEKSRPLKSPKITMPQSGCVHRTRSKVSIMNDTRSLCSCERVSGGL